MSKYRAIVSITFDDDDLDDFSEWNDGKHCDAQEILQGSLDNFVLGCPWIEQIFKDGKPMIRRLTKGVMVEISEESDTVEDKTVYAKHPDGKNTERVTCCGQQWYYGPARVVFADKWPWERRKDEIQTCTALSMRPLQ